MDTTGDDGTLRDSRRHQLAYKLMAHKVRTRTISAMTGLSRNQQRTLRRRWGITGRMRPRGSSPVSLSRFTRSMRARSEGASLAAICRAYGVLLPQALADISRRGPLPLELAERLCHAYETFCACFPEGKIQFEDMLNFVLGIAKNEVIGLGQCASCGATVLIDRLDSRQPTCGQCQPARTARGST
jgi:hypothetical protein